MPEFQVNGQFSLDRFQEVISSTLMSTSEFLELIRTSLLIDQPRLGILLTAFSLPDETSYTIALVNQERDINYMNIPFQYFLSQSIVISPEKIKAYYDAHQNEFMTPEQVNVEYIQLSPTDLAATFAPTDAMLKSFYNENINSYTQPTAWKLVDILIPVAATATPDEITKAQVQADDVVRSLRNGSDFATVASHYSSNNLASQGMMTLNQVPAELQKTVAGMTAVNQISDPIKTSSGFVIVKVVDYKQPKIQPFESVKDKVKETYIRQHAEEKFIEMRDQLADLTYEHPDSLQVAAKTLNLPIQTSELFTKDKAGKDISQYKKVRDTAFSNDVMNLQNNSDVIQLNPETVIVLRIKSHIASTLLPLKDISKQIEDKLKAEEAETRAATLASDIMTKLQAGADPIQLANIYKFTWSKAGFIGRYSTKVDPAILDAAFRLPNPANDHKNVVYGKTKLTNGYAIVALNAVKPGVAADSKQQAVFDEQVQNSQGVLEYELYKQSQTRKAKIEIM
jgi:peptidyl-prolyl cis-trans isomerase D